ncbi:MAG: CTP synthase (glutamine hydrolyzing) [Fibromonadales bacterium]|nr:CTP synthase (glutamine hydrolyzing) [Fibromonadales bacterium]
MSADNSYNGKSKFIFITGGVLSGLGKGVAAASIGALLSRFRVIPVKCDGYLNVDPGTMNPIEHGEVFVLDDGGEVDMDFGHYERFLNISGKSEWSLTMGKVFSTLIERERQGVYAGMTIQFIPHVADVIKDHLFKIASKENADVVLVEIGGTVGDLENEFYIEAARQLSHIVGQDNCVFAHLTYIPIPSGVHEQKSKPTQMSVRDLNTRGIYPDIIIGRCSEPLTKKIKEKIALYGNIPSKNVISGLDMKSVYEIPLSFQEEGILDILFKKLKISGAGSPKMDEWKRLVDVFKKNYENPKKILNVALCGKYTQLEDSYASIREAIIHAAAHLNVACKLTILDTESLSDQALENMASFDAIIVPGGFGSRGMEGKISVIKIARENNIPFLGICYGMQLSVVEYARHKCSMPLASTVELESEGIEVKEPVIAFLPGLEYVKVLGGTLRKGGYDVFLKKGTLVEKIYNGAPIIRERFRHRYEVNPMYINKLEENGLVFSGYSAKEDNIMQIMEIPDHPFFVGCQFHPELTSTLLKPSPLFYHLLKAAHKRSDERG